MLTLVLWQHVVFLCVSRTLFRMSLSSLYMGEMIKIQPSWYRLSFCLCVCLNSMSTNLIVIVIIVNFITAPSPNCCDHYYYYCYHHLRNRISNGKQSCAAYSGIPGSNLWPEVLSCLRFTVVFSVCKMSC